MICAIFYTAKTMHTVGQRKIREISLHASADLLREGAMFNDEIHLLPTGKTTYFPKGVFRYSSHEQANAHWIACVAKGMAEQVALNN